MQVTKVQFTKVNSSNNFVGYATITFDACFVVRNIKVFKKTDGTFSIQMPVRNTKIDQSRSKDRRNITYIAQPINSECRCMIEEAVTKELQHLASTLS